ncbi:MAG: sialidase family protein [Nitrososphaera sp.]|jgi:hypothetical protein
MNSYDSVIVFSAILVFLLSGYQSASADSYPNEIKTATSGSHVYVVWQQRSDGPVEKQDIYFRTSSDNGATFADTIRLNENQNQDPWGPGMKEESPSIAASENHVYIIWNEYGNSIPSGWKLAISDDYGQHFRRPVLLPAENAYEAYLATSESNVYIFWVNGTLMSTKPNYHLFAEKSDDYGKTFDAPVEMFTDFDISFPQIVISGDDALVAWNSPIAVHHNGNTYYNSTLQAFAKLNLQNLNGTITKMSNSTLGLLDKMVTTGNNIYILSQKHQENLVYNNDIVYLTISQDNGRTFEAPIDLTGKYDVPRQINSADLDVSGNDIHVMWSELDGQGADAIPRLYVISSDDNGKSFGNKTLVSEAISNNLITHGDKMYLVYETKTHKQLFLATSSDAGKSFTKRPLNNDTEIVDQSHVLMTGNGTPNVYWHGTVGNSNILSYLGDINGTKVTNLLDKLPKQYQSIWTNDDTIIKKSESNISNTISISSDARQEVLPTNTTINHGPKSYTNNQLQNKSQNQIPIGTPFKSILNSPLKQFKSGIAPKDVTCNDDLQLIFKTKDNSPACVKTNTVFRLLALGWGYPPSPFTTKTDLLNSKISGGEIKEFQYDPQNRIIIIKIQTVSDGSLMVIIPKIITDLNPSDKPFKDFHTVLADGREVNVDLVPTENGSSFTIPFTNGTQEIEIIGNQVGQQS